MKNVFLIIVFVLILPLNIFSNDSSDRLFLIGKRLQNEKNYSDAIIIFNKILETSSIQNRLWVAAAYFELGNIYYELENYQQAHDNYNNLIRYYPSHYLVPNAKNMLEKTKSAMRDEEVRSFQRRETGDTPDLLISRERFQPRDTLPRDTQPRDLQNRRTDQLRETSPTTTQTRVIRGSDEQEARDARAELLRRTQRETPISDDRPMPPISPDVQDDESASKESLVSNYKQILRELEDKSLYESIKKGNEFFEKSDYNDAYRVFSKLIAENKDNFLILYNYGITLTMLERYDEAAAVLERIFEKYPNDIEVILNLAFIYQQQNKWLLARMLWRTALRIDPDNSVAAHNLKVLSETLEM